MPFQPGVSGNPYGRPPGSTSVKTKIQQALLDVLDAQVPGSTQTNFQAVLEKWIADCRNGVPSAQRLMVERLFNPEMLADIETALARSKRDNIDYLTYRIKNMSHDKQQSLLLTKEHLMLVMAGRRSGKTEGFARLFAKTMIERDAAVCLYLGKTITVAVEQMFQPVMEIFNALGIETTQSSRSEGIIRIDRGSELHIKGNSTSDERDKLRGFKWDLAVIDEIQSQAALPYLYKDIIGPALRDRKGRLALGGTGPKVAGTFWEELWTNQDRYKAFRLNMNIADNCFIDDHLEQLEQVKKQYNWTDTSSTYQREYLGLPVYDLDALCFRMTPKNYYSEASFNDWIKTTPISDIQFVGGLDFGFSDFSSFVIVAYSPLKKDAFLIYEYKANRINTEEFVANIKKGIDMIKQKYSNMPFIKNNQFMIYCDTEGLGKQLSYDLATIYKLPVSPAYQGQHDLQIENLQNEVRQGNFKVPEEKTVNGVKVNSIFHDESLMTVFARNDKDELTREIDDETYHPELLMSVIYACRTIWVTRRV